MSVLSHVDFDYYEYLSLQSIVMAVLLLCDMRLHRMFDEMQNEDIEVVHEVVETTPIGLVSCNSVSLHL